MIELNWQRCNLSPFEHQKVGVRELVLDTNPARGRVLPCVFALFDQVGAGKSKQIVDASQVLFEDSQRINTMVLVTPGFARGVWSNPDPDLGEVAKHGWRTIDNVVREYSSEDSSPIRFSAGLNWIVTNYEFIRREPRLKALLKQLAGRRIWLVLDEAWSIKTHTSDNAKACLKLRSIAQRATILDGSPVDGSPLDLFSKMNFLDRRILAINVAGVNMPMSYTHFKARYAVDVPVLGKSGKPLLSPRGREIMQTVSYKNLEELTAKTAPYVLQRLTRECIDLPEIRPPVLIEARLKPETWKIYVQMRDDMVAWLSDQSHSIARQAIVKGLRLAQITSGYLGGVEEISQAAYGLTDEPMDIADMFKAHEGTAREIGREKLDTFLEWLKNSGPMPDRLLVWTRFRPCLERTVSSLRADYDVYELKGGQKPEEREAAKRALSPFIKQDGPVAVVGIPSAGGAALNFAGANLAVYLSNDFNFRSRSQSEGRIDRPGQTRPITYVDVLATGPKGQKTIDHVVFKALLNKERISEWTAVLWRAKLLEE